jgi:VWFA-related protein
MCTRLMRSRRSAVLTLALAGFMSAHVFGLSPQTATEEEPVPTVRVSTHLVLVDAVVTDKHNQPVLGLRAEDFTVQEKGKSQKIAFFSVPAQPGSRPVVPSLPPGTYSNRPEYRAPHGPTTVIVLDVANTPFQDQSYGRLQMLKFVREQHQAGQSMAIFALTNRLWLLQDFTDDPEVLSKALLRYEPGEPIISPGTTGAVVTPLPAGSSLAGAYAEIQRFQEVEVAYFMDRRIDTTLLAMRSLARILGGIPGRKNVIWLTAGFPFSLFPDDLSQLDLPRSDPMQCGSAGCVTMPSTRIGAPAGVRHDQYADRIRDVAAQLASSQLAIYPVDVRGLETKTSVNSITSQMTMEEMAWETGGRAFVNRNDVHNGVAMALQDNSASYTIGYYPDNKKWDQKYRTISVKVNRAGVEVRHRHGYFAVDPTEVKDKQPAQELTEALLDRAPDTLVIFDAMVTPADKGKTRVDFLIDPSSISVENVTGGKKVDVDFYAAIVSTGGKLLASQSMRLDHTFPLDIYQKILQQGMRVHIDLDSPAGKNELRMAVRDGRTGYLGTINALATR